MENLPKKNIHIGIMHKGNRRWAKNNSIEANKFYDSVISTILQAAIDLKNLSTEYNVKEVTFCGCSLENMQGPKADKFSQVIFELAKLITQEGIAFQIIGDIHSTTFPALLRPFTVSNPSVIDSLKVNFLVNYSAEWDLKMAIQNAQQINKRNLPIQELIGSALISPIDLTLRWGGDHRFNGFLPVQTAHATLYVIDKLWPEYSFDDLKTALDWYKTQYALYSERLQVPEHRT